MSSPADPSKPPAVAQPKISQRLILRTAVFLFIIAVLLFGYRYVQEQHGDFNHGSSNSAGVIAAIQLKDSGQQAVLIHPDGTISAAAGWKDGSSDEDIAWSPDGRFLYFVSDRDGGTFHLYRQNPDQSSIDPMTAGTRGRSDPTFPADDPPDATASMLLICGGTVQAFDPQKKITPQLLPPPTSNITQTNEEGAGGSEAEFAAYYGGLGNAFKYARYCKQNQFIAAVMERETGELLLIQSLAAKDGQLPKPVPVIAGDHVAFDVSPKDGSLVFVVQNFRPIDPDNPPKKFIKNGKFVPPFANCIGSIDPAKLGIQVIGASPDSRICFGSPAVSPDGASVLFTAGPYDKSTQTLTSKLILEAPIQNLGMRQASRIAIGDAYEPAWSPDGSKIIYALRTNGKRDIYTAEKDGSSPTDVTAGKGDFLTPVFSPQMKSSG